MTAMNRVGRLTLACALILCMASVASAQTTWYVDDDGVNDPGPGDVTVSDPNEDGSLTHPFDAIQEAIDVAVAGDEVIVADGTYTGAGNKDLDYAGKSITVRSENGPTSCVIDCEGDGRGALFDDGETTQAVMEGMTISNGYASLGGGVTCMLSSSATLRECVVSSCSAANGGAIGVVLDCTLALDGCRIVDNECTQYGGGVYIQAATLNAVNCLCYGNNGGVTGGGMWATGSAITLVNCTLVQNTTVGGGLALVGSCVSTIENSIISQNMASGDIEIAIGNASQPSTLTLSYSDIPAGQSAVEVESGCTLVWGDGMISADPMFKDAANGDFRLAIGSPCVDAGTNAPAGSLSSTDLDGNPRPTDGDANVEPWTGVAATADMGVYESDTATTPLICVSPAVMEFYAGPGGSNPPVQILSIRNCGIDVLHWEITETCSWLGLGVTSGESSGETDDVVVSVDISGLPEGYYSYLLEVADPAAWNNPVIVPVVLHVGNALHVPSQYATIQAALDAAVTGDTIKVADGTYTGVGNKDLDFGGKDIVLQSANGPSVCVIDCENDGRGFWFHNRESAAAVVDGFTVTNGYFQGASWEGGGAVWCTDRSHPTIRNCIFCNCEGRPFGGAINVYYSNSLFENCLIVNNYAGDGGGVFATHSNSAFVNCTIANNTADDEGGGLQLLLSCELELVNSIVAHNTGVRGDEISLRFSGSPSEISLARSAVLGGEDAIRLSGDFLTVNWGDGMVGSDPLFVDWTGSDYHLVPGSPCVDGGINDPISGLPAFDLDGVARPIDGNYSVESWTGVAATADMGAYELASPTVPAICVSPSELAFEALPIGPNADQVLSIRNCGAGTLDWEIVEDCPWLSVAPASGASTGETDDVTVSVDITGLVAGEYSCVLEVADTQNLIASRYVLVQLTVRPPWLGVTPEMLLFKTEPGGPSPADQTFVIRNLGTDVLNWEVFEDCPWLSVSPSSGSSSGESDEVIVSVDSTGMAERGYSCILEVATAEASNSPQYVQVYLAVGEYLYVPGAYSTIQEAIDVSVPGMTVLLADGTYTGEGNRGLDFGGKDITVSSINGPDNCVIDCEGDARGFYFHSGETPAAVVRDITIRGGRGEDGLEGGCIRCEGSSPTFVNCVISESEYAEAFGGGLYCSGSSSPSFIACEFLDNATWQSGGAAYIGGGAAAEFIGCTFDSNLAGEFVAEAYGGAIFCATNSNVSAVNCVFANNYALALLPASDAAGGAVYVDRYGTFNATNCTFYSNWAQDYWPPTPSERYSSHISRGSYGQGEDHNLIRTVEDDSFVDASQGDFRLQAGSPFIDAGDNTDVPLDTYDLDGDGNTTERLPVDCEGMLRFADRQGTADTGVADLPNYPYVVDKGAFEYQCMGDLDGDGAINLADLQFLLSGYGDTDATYAGGDLDGSGTVDLADLQLLLSAYGQTCP